MRRLIALSALVLMICSWAVCPVRADTYEVWAARVFSSDEQADPAISGRDAAPAGDGISNLQKFAFGLDPHQDGTSGLPTVGTRLVYNGQTGRQEPCPSVAFQLPSGYVAENITCLPETASDLRLADWGWDAGLTAYLDTQYVLQASGYVPLVTYYVRSATGQNPPRLFLRVRVIEGHALPTGWQLQHFGRTGVDPEADPDGDGLTNWQEFVRGTEPNDFYNGQPPSFLAVLGGGDQRGDPGAVLPTPVSVAVCAPGATANAPVTFQVTAGGARLAASGDPAAVPLSRLTVQATGLWADGGGIPQLVAQVYVYLPATANDASVITASVATGGQTVSVSTTAASDDPALAPPTGLSATPTSPTTAQLAWTAGDPARATTVQISLDGGTTWRTLGTVAAGVRNATVAGLQTNATATFRVFTAPGGTGTPPDAGGDGTAATLTLPADASTLPTGGAGSAATANAAARPLSGVMVKIETSRAQLGWPLGPYGFVNQAFESDCYLSRTLAYKETHTRVDLPNYDKSYTVTRDSATNPHETGTHTVNPPSAEPYTPYYNFVHPYDDFDRVLYWQPSGNLTPVYADDQFLLNNDQYTYKSSHHQDAVHDQDGNVLTPPDNVTQELACTASQAVHFSSLGPLTEGLAKLGTGPLPDNASPANSLDDYLLALRAIGNVVQTTTGLQFGSVFDLGRFQWQVNGGSSQTVYWDEQFTPFTSQPDPFGNPWSPAQHDIHTWESQGATESPIYVVDPRTRHGGQYGKYDLIALRIALVPDFDHNRVIDDNDCGKATADHPFRFWINDDHDSGDTGGDDIPSYPGVNSGRNCDDAVINGTRDLVDWFPVFLKISPLVAQLSPDDYTYKLSQADGAVNYVLTNLTPDHAGDYLTDISVARGLTQPSFDPTYNNALFAATPAGGYALPKAFLTDIRDNKKGVILIKGKQASTNPLVLTVYKNSAPGTAVVSVKLPLSISPVEDMFRHRDLRPITGGTGGASERLGVPPNLPDSECNGKSFVFVHGYNVNGEQARGAQSEVFKRMYWSGSHAKFYGVSWYGDQSQITLPIIGSVSRDYQTNILHAFGTASTLAAFLNQLSAGGKDVTLCAHSLGNMLASSAIHDWGAVVARYYMMDCAVAKEAYKEDEEDFTQVGMVGMENTNWLKYDRRLWCSEWYSLFYDGDGNPTADNRSQLTWSGRLSKAVKNTEAFNFYSRGEDVLANPSGIQFLPLSPIEVWNNQERNKGLNIVGDNILTSAYGGWRFNGNYYGSDGSNLSNADLKSEPFFDNTYPRDLYGSAGSDYAALKAQGNTLLAEMIPCLSFATGRNPLSNLNPSRNIDMQALENQWTGERANNDWHHGDFQVVAYLFTHNLFDDYVQFGNLSNSPTP